jgi:hypothetical protein
MLRTDRNRGHQVSAKQSSFGQALENLAVPASVAEQTHERFQQHHCRLDQADEEIITYIVSDEAVEAAAGTDGPYTVSQHSLHWGYCC